MLRLFSFLLLSCALATVASATPQLSKVFSDHMVLQRDKPIRVWGTAGGGEKLTVCFDGESVTTNADKKTGKWLVTLGARPASSAPKKLVVESGSDYGSTTVDDVLVGDVWLVTGQSNMEMTFRWGVVDGDLVQANASRYPLVRAMKSNWAYRTALQDEPNLRCRWYLPAQANIGGTSAIGWMFATEVFDRVKVPIGLVDLSYSGSKIEPFIPIEGFRTEPSLASFVSFFEAATTNTTIAEWRAHTRNMTMHYNGMVAPFVNLSAKGWIWYQGCSNADDAPGVYAAKMRALAKGWRTAFGQNLPFCFAQLSAFHAPGGRPAAGGGYTEIRLEQLEALRTIPDCGMVVTMDVGEGDNIHPKCKKPVADRFARWALNRVYGCGDVAYSGPVYREMKVEGDTVRIFFDFAEGGLVSATQDISDNEPPTPNEGPLRMFAIAGADGIWYDARARIDGETVVVSAPEVKEPKAIRYAYDTNPGYTNLLYNAALLPATPFSTNGREKSLAR